MASTYTEHALIEKFESRAVGWDDGSNKDLIDYGISRNYSNFMVAFEDITQYQPVAFHSVANQCRKAQSAATPYPAMGIALATVAAGGVVPIMHAGFLSNVAWAWTVGDNLCLSTTAGAIVTDATASNYASSVTANAAAEIFVQQIGEAVSTTRAFFNFRREPRPRCIVSSGPALSSVTGAATVTTAFQNVTGTQWANCFVCTPATGTIVLTYPFLIPENYKAFSLASWGIRIYGMASTATPTLDFTLFDDGAANHITVTFTPVNNTTWVAHDINQSVLQTGACAISKGKTCYVTVVIAGASGIYYVEQTAKLRYVPELSGFLR